MRFYIPDHIARWLGPAIIILIGIIVIFDIPVGRQMLCEPEGNCLISWVSALSGWAALAGAILTIAVMREQLADQKRQTDYITGENPPEAYFDSSMRDEKQEYFAEAKITIINRNRRTLVLNRIEASLPGGLAVGIRATSVDNELFEWPLSTMGHFPYVHRTVPGKEDGARASRCVIDCHIFDGKDLVSLSPNADRWVSQPITVKIFGDLKGSIDTPIELLTSGFVSIER